MICSASIKSLRYGVTVVSRSCGRCRCRWVGFHDANGRRSFKETRASSSQKQVFAILALDLLFMVYLKWWLNQKINSFLCFSVVYVAIVLMHLTRHWMFAQWKERQREQLTIILIDVIKAFVLLTRQLPYRLLSQ